MFKINIGGSTTMHVKLSKLITKAYNKNAAKFITVVTYNILVSIFPKSADIVHRGVFRTLTNIYDGTFLK